MTRNPCCSFPRNIPHSRWNPPNSRWIPPSVLKSGPVRFFTIFGDNCNCNRSSKFQKKEKPDWDRQRPVHSGFYRFYNRSWPVQFQPVDNRSKSGQTDLFKSFCAASRKSTTRGSKQDQKCRKRTRIDWVIVYFNCKSVNSGPFSTFLVLFWAASRALLTRGYIFT